MKYSVPGVLEVVKYWVPWDIAVGEENVGGRGRWCNNEAGVFCGAPRAAEDVVGVDEDARATENKQSATNGDVATAGSMLHDRWGRKCGAEMGKEK
jgi:hypothetical protein